MSNEIRTRRLIVTLPLASESEAHGIASEALRPSRHLAKIIDDRMVEVPGATVTQALDDEPRSVNDISVDPFDFVDPDDLESPTVTVRVHDQVIRFLSPDEARRLAAILLRAADEAEGKR